MTNEYPPSPDISGNAPSSQHNPETETGAGEEQENVTTESTAETSESTSKGGGGRWRSFGFVVTFLVIAVTLLVAHHYSLTKDPMNWYLYQVARDTATVLDVFGERGALENPTAYIDRRPEIREDLREAGVRGVLESPEEASEEPELTPWEIWQHRVLEFREEREQLEAVREQLEPLPRPTMDTVEEHRAHVEEIIESLETAVLRHEPAPGVEETLAEAGEILDELDAALAAGGDESGVVPLLYEVEEGLRGARAAQLRSVEQELAELEVEGANKLGPRVHYVREPSTWRALRWAQEDLADLEARDDADPEEKAALEEKIEELEAQREAEHEAGGGQVPGAMFIFVVIPDCGAIPTMVIYLAAVVAFPTRWWKRLAGVLAGLPILYGVNVFRLACLGVIGSYTGPGEQFDFYHHYVWQGLYILFVVALWLIWMEVVVKGRRPWPKKNAR